MDFIDLESQYAVRVVERARFKQGIKARGIPSAVREIESAAIKSIQ